MTSLKLQPPSAAAWADLVFHVLACVETAPGDHSSLYSQAYGDWCRLHLSDEVRAAYTGCCESLSTAYRDTPRSHVLHMFPVLWDSIGEFLKMYGVPFNCIAWPSPDKRRLAAHIQHCLPVPVIDLFRDSLRIVAEAGFEAEWRQAMAFQETSYAPVLKSNIAALSSLIPGLDEAAWLVSLPLCTHGRLVGCYGARPLVCVGVPDAMLGVDVDHPLMQGCHEFFVWRELISRSDSVQADTVVGADGYTAFIEIERRAISKGERILAHGPWRSSYLRWKQTILNEFDLCD